MLPYPWHLSMTLKVIIESAIVGRREIECAVLGNEEPEVSPLW